MLRYVSATVHGPIVEIVRDQIRDGIPDRLVHQIPVEALSIRAGEYGLDPVTDAEAVLGILLHELDQEMPAEELPPIVTAVTLEEARGTVLERCRKARDGHHASRIKGKATRTTPEQDEAHVDVLESLPGLFVADRQLATLARIHMKAAVRAERERQAAPTISHKARMIDEIRTREGI
jgi:hypothetical protein